MKNYDIVEMTKSFQKGEEKGFTFFFNSLYPALLYYAFRIVNDKPVAEDIVEESMIKIWERHWSFDHPQVIKSWMYTTVRNACLNTLQQDARHNRHKEILAAEMQDQYQKSQFAEIVKAETITEVHKALKVLPPECRKIFEMMYIRNMTVREIANKMKLSLSTIKNQKARGLEILRKKCKLQPSNIPAF